MKPEKYFMKKTRSGWKKVKLTAIPDDPKLEKIYEHITPGTVIEEPEIQGAEKSRAIFPAQKSLNGGMVKSLQPEKSHVIFPVRRDVAIKIEEPPTKEKLFELLGEKLNISGKGIKTLKRV